MCRSQEQQEMYTHQLHMAVQDVSLAFDMFDAEDIILLMDEDKRAKLYKALQEFLHD